MAFKFSPCRPCCCSTCINPIQCNGVLSNSLLTTNLPSGSISYISVYNAVSGSGGWSFGSFVSSGISVMSGVTSYASCQNGLSSGIYYGISINTSGYVPYSGFTNLYCGTNNVLIQKDENRRIDFIYNICSSISGIITLSGDNSYVNTKNFYGSGITFSGLPSAGTYHWDFSFSDPGYYRQGIDFSGNITICTSGRVTQSIRPNYSGGWLCCCNLIYGPDYKWTVVSCGASVDCFYKIPTSDTGPGNWIGSGFMNGSDSCYNNLLRYNTLNPPAVVCNSGSVVPVIVQGTASCGGAILTFPCCVMPILRYKSSPFSICVSGTFANCYNDAKFGTAPPNSCAVGVLDDIEYSPCNPDGGLSATSVTLSSTTFYIDPDCNYIQGNVTNISGPSDSARWSATAQGQICSTSGIITSTRSHV